LRNVKNDQKGNMQTQLILNGTCHISEAVPLNGTCHNSEAVPLNGTCHISEAIPLIPVLLG